MKRFTVAIRDSFNSANETLLKEKIKLECSWDWGVKVTELTWKTQVRGLSEDEGVNHTQSLRETAKHEEKMTRRDYIKQLCHEVVAKSLQSEAYAIDFIKFVESKRKVDQENALAAFDAKVKYDNNGGKNNDNELIAPVAQSNKQPRKRAKMNGR